jgi:hypothetical protein
MQLLRPDAPVAIRATISAIGFATCLAAAIAVPQGMTHDSVARFAATYALECCRSPVLRGGRDCRFS